MMYCFLGSKYGYMRQRGDFCRRKVYKNLESQYNSSTGKFHCPTCNNGYGRRDTMLAHYRYECGKAPRYKCPYCPMCSKKTSNIYQHVRSVHPNEPVTLVKLYWVNDNLNISIDFTDFCTYSLKFFIHRWIQEIFHLSKTNKILFHRILYFFHSYRSLWIYITSLRSISEFERFILENFYWLFTVVLISEFWNRLQPNFQQSTSSANARKNEEPNQGRKFMCPKCDKGFSQSYSMYRHYRYECDTMPRYQCPYCSHVSKWTHSIYNHVRKIHPGLEVRVNRLY